jgi:AcrR family transcriptional regulator
LLDAAEAEFGAKGFDGARLSAIARVAGVQQALIHHYFSDKGGLYRDVIARALGGISAETLGILAGLNAKAGILVPRRRLTRKELAEIVDAFVELLLRFYGRRGSVVSILRHESQGGGQRGGNPRGDSLAIDVFVSMIKPVFDAVVARIAELRARGDLHKDVDPRHLCLSAVAMASATFQEQPLIEALWDVDVSTPEFIAARKKHIVRLLMRSLVDEDP